MRQESHAKRLNLTDTLRLTERMAASAANLLAFVQTQTQRVIERLWFCLDEIGGTRHQAYKALERMIAKPADVYIPDRVWRCILESAGRTLRQQSDRKRIFDLLRPLMSESIFESEDALRAVVDQCSERLSADGSFERFGYLLNVSEQIANFYDRNDRLPESYYEMQAAPGGSPFLTFAGDDGGEKGQVFRLRIVGDELVFRFKYPLVETPLCERDWSWLPEETIHIPEILTARLASGSSPQAPNLRWAVFKGGKWGPVLDFITETPLPPRPSKEGILSFDWGVRRLATMVVLSPDGEQLVQPVFLDLGGMTGKQNHLRSHIDWLKSKRDRLPEEDPRREPLQHEIDACWRKYEARNKAAAHLASLVIVSVASMFGCSAIVGEWLKTLKARKGKSGKGRQARFRNWQVSTTVRAAVWKRVEYKSRLLGIRAITISPRGTSHECPRCGARGKTVASPEHHRPIHWGHWFKCQECGFNGDRDYIAALNIARRGLAKLAKKKEPKPVPYSGSGLALPFPPIRSFANRIFTALTGFNKSAVLMPVYPLIC